jgi:2-hydroxy-6-oxonona-2,4-dienedioate hydrolase
MGMDRQDTSAADLDIVWTVVNGTRIYSRISNSPGDLALPPVVLVHGLSASSRYMLPAARALAPYCRVYAPDLPGFGYSQKPPRVLDLEGLADALAAWTRAVGLKRAVFIGNSLGCQKICNLALRHPELIEGAVFLGPTMDPQASAWREFFRLMKDLFFFEPLSFLGVAALEFLHAGPWWAQRTYHFGLNDDVLGKFARMRAPVLVVRGEHDPITPVRWADQLVALLPQAAPLVTVPGTGHCLHSNAPGAFLDATLPFLRDLAQRSSLVAMAARGSDEGAA